MDGSIKELKCTSGCQTQKGIGLALDLVCPWLSSQQGSLQHCQWLTLLCPLPFIPYQCQWSKDPWQSKPFQIAALLLSDFLKQQTLPQDGWTCSNFHFCRVSSPHPSLAWTEGCCGPLSPSPAIWRRWEGLEGCCGSSFPGSLPSPPREAGAHHAKGPRYIPFSLRNPDFCLWCM